MEYPLIVLQSEIVGHSGDVIANRAGGPVFPARYGAEEALVPSNLLVAETD